MNEGMGLPPKREGINPTQVSDLEKETLKKEIIDLRPFLYSYCLKKLGRERNPSAIADDITQKTLLKALNKITTFNGHSKLSSWLCAIANNTIIDFLRQKKRNSTVEHQLPQINVGNGELRDIETSTEHPEAEMNFAMDYASIKSILDKDELAIITLLEQGYMIEEISEILGMPQGTVKSKTFRMRGKLRTHKKF